MKKVALSVLLIIFMGLMLAACGSGKVRELRITAFPNRTFLIGTTLSDFNKSLEEGFVSVRYLDGTADAAIPMTDPKITVTGFKSDTVGIKMITVKHNDYSSLEATYSIEILAIETASFTISKNPGFEDGGWQEYKYYEDVEIADIDLTGGLIIPKMNSGAVGAAISLKDNATVISVQPFMRNSKKLAEVTVKLNGTNLVGKFEVELMDTYPVSIAVKETPRFNFYTSDAVVADINPTGLVLEATRNSGKKFDVFASDGAVSIIELDIEIGKVAIEYKFNDDITLSTMLDINVVDTGALTVGYALTLDWEELAPLSADDAKQLCAAFDSLVRLSSSEQAAYTVVVEYINDIVIGSFYARAVALLEKQAEINGLESSTADYRAACAEFVTLYKAFTTIGQYSSLFGTKELYKTVVNEVEVAITIKTITDSLLSTYNSCPKD